MTEPPAQAAGLVATGRSEGDAYPLPPGVPLAPTERLGDMAPVPGGPHVPSAPAPGRHPRRPDAMPGPDHGRTRRPRPGRPADARLPLYTAPSE